MLSHSILQWTMLCQNSPEAIVPIHLHPLPKPMSLCSLSLFFFFFFFLQVARVTVRVNKHIHSELTKEASQKTPTSKKLKKIRGSKLCRLCSKVNENLNQNESVEVLGIVEIHDFPGRLVGSQ